MTCNTGWFKSSYSGSGNDSCIEVRMTAESSVGLRDTKDREAGALWLGSAVWAALLGRARRYPPRCVS